MMQIGECLGTQANFDKCGKCKVVIPKHFQVKNTWGIIIPRWKSQIFVMKM
jgi:hypothetical protein